jgi:hypothetical protein
LRKSNAKKTRQHYRNQGKGVEPFGPTPSSTPRTAPLTVPRAPLNSNNYLTGRLIGGSSLISPRTVRPSPRFSQWTSGYESLDKHVAALGCALDVFGSNEGIITRCQSSPSRSGSGTDDIDNDFEESTLGCELQLDAADEHARVPQHILREMSQQSAQIALLQEENLNLQERLYLMEQKLKDFQRAACQEAESGDALT